MADAKALHDAGRRNAAYYLAGYEVECALKSCVARKTKEGDFPIRDADKKFYIHDLARLSDNAGLGEAYQAEAQASPEFRDKWAVVKDWTQESRYRPQGRQKAEQIFAAISDPECGVLQWLRKNW